MATPSERAEKLIRRIFDKNEPPVEGQEEKRVYTRPLSSRIAALRIKEDQKEIRKYLPKKENK